MVSGAGTVRSRPEKKFVFDMICNFPFQQALKFLFCRKMTLASQPLPSPAVTGLLASGGGSLAHLPPEIIRVHILPRLDGPTLASAACASSVLRALICSSSDDLWEAICAATWPSTAADPTLRHVISTFSSGFRSFYSDAYLLPLSPTKIPLVKVISPIPILCVRTRTLPTKLISAIDVFYEGELVFSTVKETETAGQPFMSARFRICVNTSIPIPWFGLDNPIMRKHMQENLRISWVVVDPTRKRALILTGPGKVWISGSWIHRVVWVRFSSVLRYGLGQTELAVSHVYVTCHSMAAGLMEIKEVSVSMQDEHLKEVTGYDGLVILASAMGSRRRRRLKGTRAVKDGLKEFDSIGMLLWGDMFNTVRGFLLIFVIVMTCKAVSYCLNALSKIKN